jgi:hypothetical protein
VTNPVSFPSFYSISVLIFLSDCTKCTHVINFTL